MISAIIGAGIAAIPAFLLARRASRETLSRDREGRRLAEKAAMLSAMVKLTEIINGLGGLHRHIEDSIARAETDAVEGPHLWSKVSPIIGTGDRGVVFDADELAPLLGVKEAGLLNDLLELSARYASLKEGVETYAHRRTLLTDKLSATMQGPIGHLKLDAEEYAAFLPRFVELDSLVKQLREMARSYYGSALNVGARFGPAAQRALDDRSFPALDLSKAPRPSGPATGIAES